MQWAKTTCYIIGAASGSTLSTIGHFAKMVDVLEFVDNITLKWLIFHQNIPEAVMLFV